MKEIQERYVIVRTYSAGVHFGRLLRRDGKEVVLAETRRIWSWQGANSLNEISLHGVGKGSRISEPALENTLTDAIEVLVCTSKAIEKFADSTWAK